MEDTISAISTANGRGGVAVIRISGSAALSVAEKMFSPIGKTNVKDLEPYRMYPGNIHAERFDDFGLAVYFKAPKSYTGEDIVEFHCHGGTEIAKGILKQTFACGARPATAGEFTKRAFLNGKMSLDKAEGVADMINADSESMVKAGFSLLEGHLGEQIKTVQSELTTLIASIEVDIDYPEEELEHSVPDLVNIKEKLSALTATLTNLRSSYETVGKKVKNGVSVAIVGRPNSGKSSLLNALLGYEKAIVSDIEGTTRDVVEGELMLAGYRFILYDTAGMRESEDKIEQIGVLKAEKTMENADIVLHVVDASAPLSEKDLALEEEIEKNNRLLHKVLLSKKDLPPKQLKADESWNKKDVLSVSCFDTNDVAAIKKMLEEAVCGAYSFDSGFVVEQRHYDAIVKAENIMLRAKNSVDKVTLDLMTVDLTEAWQTLGEITGETANEEIVSEIFSKFCVGK